MEELIKGLPDYITERGNTLLVRSESDGVAFIAQLPDNTYMIFSHLPENYPAISMEFNLSEIEVVVEIHTNFNGWKVQKCNIAGVYQLDGEIDTPPEFQSGEVVHWEDPDDGQTSRNVKIHTYQGDSSYLATEVDGTGDIEVMGNELTRI